MKKCIEKSPKILTTKIEKISDDVNNKRFCLLKLNLVAYKNPPKIGMIETNGITDTKEIFDKVLKLNKRLG